MVGDKLLTRPIPSITDSGLPRMLGGLLRGTLNGLDRLYNTKKLLILL